MTQWCVQMQQPWQLCSINKAVATVPFYPRCKVANWFSIHQSAYIPVFETHQGVDRKLGIQQAIERKKMKKKASLQRQFTCKTDE